jgi:hypothetical protein
MYVEDMEFCWQVKRAGLEVVYSPEAVCVHEGSQSLPRARLLPMLAASRLHYANRHSGAIGANVQRVGIGIGEGLRAIGGGEAGYRRGHLEALGVILRGDDGYRLPSATSTECGGSHALGPKDLQLHSVRRHFVTYWLVWAVLALLAVVGNEVVDRMVWDESHPADGDVLLAIVLVATAFVGSYFVARKRRPRSATTSVSTPGRGVASAGTLRRAPEDERDS